MSDAAQAAQIYRTAARLNREDPILEGSLMRFPDYGQLVMTGDMHGHGRNFAKLKRYCDLKSTPVRHVILHELIHPEPEHLDEPDLSHELLLEAARWKCDFPEQVHFLQSNHELSQLTGHEISKGGRVVTRDFEDGVERTYADGFIEVIKAMADFIESFPLAGVTTNRVFISHSLPGPRDYDRFDPAVLKRVPEPREMLEGGSAYALVWGRYQTKVILEELCTRLDVDCFLCGHQPQEEGYAVVHDRMIILASDHNHGVLLPFDLKKPYTVPDLVAQIRPFAAIE